MVEKLSLVMADACTFSGSGCENPLKSEILTTDEIFLVVEEQLELKICSFSLSKTTFAAMDIANAVSKGIFAPHHILAAHLQIQCYMCYTTVKR